MPAPGFWSQFLAKKNRVRGFVPRTEGDFTTNYRINILDNFIGPTHTFGVRRSIDALDLEIQPRSVSGKIWTGSGF